MAKGLIKRVRSAISGRFVKNTPKNRKSRTTIIDAMRRRKKR